MAAVHFDVLGIGNAIVDVIARTEEDFLVRHGMHKGAMTLIDEQRAADIYDAMGPAVEVSLGGSLATLTWSGRSGPVIAGLHLPPGLRWTVHRGETDPPLGWYSPRFGSRVETSTLVGAGTVENVLEFVTRLQFPTGVGHG